MRAEQVGLQGHDRLVPGRHRGDGLHAGLLLQVQGHVQGVQVGAGALRRLDREQPDALGLQHGGRLQGLAGPAPGRGGDRGRDDEPAAGQLVGQGSRVPGDGAGGRSRRGGPGRGLAGSGALPRCEGLAGHRGQAAVADGADGGPDVGGGGAAAAADQGHPGLGEPADVAGEVAAVDGELEAARAGAARLPGVRLGADRHRRVADQVLGHGQHALRADGAVGAEHGHRQAGQHGGHLPGRLPAQGVRVVGEGGLGDDRHVGQAGDRGDRLDQLVEVAERLQDEQVDALAGRPGPGPVRG